MKELHRKGCVLTLALLAVFRLAECRHLLDGGFSEGKMLEVQDRVLGSCTGHFMCKPFPYYRTIGLTCLHADFVCDGTEQCENGEDENKAECGAGGGGKDHGGHGGGGQEESRMVLYDSRANDMPPERGYDVIDEPKGGGVRDTSPLSSPKKGPDTGRSHPRPHIIVIQQPAPVHKPEPMHKPPPKKMRHMPPPKKGRRPPIPFPVPYPVGPPMMGPPPYMGPPPMMGPPMGMGMGMNPLLLAQLLDK